VFILPVHLLIDAGSEFDGYAANITRGFPVCSKFTAEQREMYEIVLAAQRAAIDAVQPGKHWNEPHESAVRVLIDGLAPLKLLKTGSRDAHVEDCSYKRFYTHRTGHWLGMACMMLATTRWTNSGT